MTGIHRFVGCSAGWLMGLALLAASSAASAQQPPAREATPPARGANPPVREANLPEQDRWQVRVYRVTDLVLPRPDYPYRGSEIPTTGQSPPQVPGAFGGGIGGGGFGGGFGAGGLGGGGGGGFFQISDQQAAQGLDGSASGFSPFGDSIGSGTPDSAGLRFSMDSLIEAIQTTIEPSSWRDMGGEAVCTPFGGLLLVKQTLTVHQQIDSLLTLIREEGGTAQAVTLEAHWLLLGSDDLARLAPEPREGRRGGPALVDRDVLKQLADSATRYRGRITCFSDQTVHLVSGRRMTAVISGVPTVGQHVVGYHPIISVPNIGVLLQVRPTLLPDKPVAVVNLESTVTSLAGGGHSIPLRSATSTAEGADASAKGADAAGASTMLNLDRLSVEAHHLATTVRLPLGQPALVGGLSMVTDKQPAGGEESAQKQLYLVVELTVAEDRGP